MLDALKNSEPQDYPDIGTVEFYKLLVKHAMEKGELKSDISIETAENQTVLAANTKRVRSAKPTERSVVEVLHVFPVFCSFAEMYKVMCRRKISWQCEKCPARGGHLGRWTPRRINGSLIFPVIRSAVGVCLGTAR